MIDCAKIEELRSLARSMRHYIIDMIGYDSGKVGHLGGSCSCADIVAALYGYKMHWNQDREDRDRFLLSKGHAALVQYAVLAEFGVIDRDELSRVKTLGCRLQGHPDRNKTPAIEANTGSLGQGLSLGLGMALGQRLKGWRGKTYVLLGDGELSEGQIWEAAASAAAYKEDKLVGIIDRNRYQATGATQDVLDLGDVGGKFKAFGWRVFELDGHDMRQICEALDAIEEQSGRPAALICNTIKGKGVAFAENSAQFHNASLSYEQFVAAHASIDAML